MAGASTPITDDVRRWVVTGVCLTKVVTPALRSILATEIPKWHQALCQPPIEIDKQVFGLHQTQLHPSTLNLNYKNINNNHVRKSPCAFYDYTVKDPLSLAKLFVQPFMCKFTGFDQTMDMSAILSLISEAAPFSGAAAHARTVRTDVRNEWAHCNFANWTEAKFIAAFQNMETLLRNLNLSSEEEQKLCNELNSWKDKGLQLCFGEPVDIEILTLLRGKVDELWEAVQTWKLEEKQMSTLLSGIREIQSNLSNEINDLRVGLERCENQGSSNSLKIEKYREEMKLLIEKKFPNELSRCHVEEEEKIPYVFSAPPRNRHFTGRTKEIQELKCILKVEETFNKKKVRVAAVCGLGGIGKTSLVSEYPHQMKDFYKGGVYWFSAEDDTFLEKTVNDIALKIGAFMHGSFDLSLSNTLKKISNRHDPSLIVLDCLDQPNLSSNMIKFLSFPSQESFFGHFVVLTRRNPSLLANEISTFEEDSCRQLECFPSQDAKQFLFSRTGVTRGEDVDSVAERLCEELGRLPLALEQAGACVRILGCSLASYLEQYRIERLQLLSQQLARPVSPGNELPERLAVHTTWRINLEHIKNSLNGPVAVRFMNACSFFNADEIEEELINAGRPEVEDMAFRKCVASPLGCRQVLKLLTDFSLFAYVEAHSSVSLHRLVQELVRESLNPESKAESLVDAVRMLSYAFSKCPSPNNLSDVPESPSHFYMWSKLCMHGRYLYRSMEDLLVTLDSVYLDPVWSYSTAKIAYECAVHLSANHKQEEAKRLSNLGYRILDWLPAAEYEMIKTSFSNNSLFPLAIPLLPPFQDDIKYSCIPAPFVSFLPLTQEASPEPDEASGVDLKQKIEKLRLDGNTSYKEGRYKEALDAYSSAINLSQYCNAVLNPLLLTNRATAYIKLLQYEDALKDANEYITRHPDCWKGYARKALALYGLNEKVSAEIAAALAFYYKRDIFLHYQPLKETFLGLQGRVFICDSVDELREAIFLQEVETDEFKILVLGSEEYVFGEPMLPWNNCILVGTRKNCSVSLKSDEIISLLKCMLANLSFCLDKGVVRCMPGSFVKIFNCNFRSSDDVTPAVLCEGELNVERSIFGGSKRDGLLCGGSGNIVVVDCSFCNNGGVGLAVFGGGTLIMKRSHIYNNGKSGLFIGSGVTKCIAISCDIHNNHQCGVLITHSTNILLERNDVFGNDLNGLYMVNSEAYIRNNNFFDNFEWGIISYSNSRCNLSTNSVFRNKGGGVRLEYRAAGESPCVVKRNKIYDNIGPGFVEGLNDLEVQETSPNASDGLRKTYLESPESLQAAKCHDNELYNNKESENVGKLNFLVPYCSNCRVKCEPNRCEKCFTDAYCSKTCQENHCSKHKKICGVLREKSSYLITPMVLRNTRCDVTAIDGPKEVGPKFSPRPPRDGRMFVVKVLIVERENKVKETITHYLVLYDRSLELYKEFNSKDIDQLVREFDVICERAHSEKKLFFHCLFENNGQLRLITNEFPEFQDW